MVKDIQMKLNYVGFNIKIENGETLASFIDNNREDIKELLNAKFGLDIIIIYLEKKQEIKVERIDKDKIYYYIEDDNIEYELKIDCTKNIKVIDYNSYKTKDYLIDAIDEAFNRVKELQYILINYNSNYYVIEYSSIFKIDINRYWSSDLGEIEKSIEYIIDKFNNYGFYSLLKKKYMEDEKKKKVIEGEIEYYKELFIKQIESKLKGEQAINFNEFIDSLSCDELSDFCNQINESLYKILKVSNTCLA